MSLPPQNPKLYHITHVDNLQCIITDGKLLSEAAINAKGGTKRSIGMYAIKERRLELSVGCYPDTKVSDYVPFYFCPRSIMLFMIHRANHPELTYRGGQEPIVHLEVDLNCVVSWASSLNRKWVFSLSNAGARYTSFYFSLDNLNLIDWNAVASDDFRSPDVKEGKQAEFLVHEFLPWTLIGRIGVKSIRIKTQVEQIIASAQHKPIVTIQPDWYF